MIQRRRDNGLRVDVVLCVDATGSMDPFINEAKTNALSLHRRIVDSMKANDKEVESVRIKVVAFRDYGHDKDEAMIASPFFTTPDQNVEFQNFVNSIKATGGGDMPENALEAVALALKSDWTVEGSDRRHAVIVFSDAAALPLGARADSRFYPEGMPKSLDELGAWWEGTDRTFASSFQPEAGRLFVFAPFAPPWNNLLSWNRCWPVFSKAGAGLGDVDIQSVVDLMVGSL